MKKHMLVLAGSANKEYIPLSTDLIVPLGLAKVGRLSTINFMAGVETHQFRLPKTELCFIHQ